MDTEVAVWVAALAGAPGVIGVAIAIVVWVKLRRVRAEQQVLLPDGSRTGILERQAALARSLERFGDNLDALRAEVARLAQRTEDGLRDALRFQGLVRYDAYGDMGGEQSWSIAILNAERSGAIVTSLHARDHARVYLKEMLRGVPSQRLSPEEQRAVAAAMGEAPASPERRPAA